MKAAFKHLSFFLIYPFGGVAFAAVGPSFDTTQTTSAVILQPDTSVSSKLGASFLTPKFEFEHLSFQSANKTSFDSEQYASELTSTGLSLKSIKGERTRVDLKWFYIEQEKVYYFDVPELSHAMNFGEYQVTVGRHLHNWSYADSFWQQGRWQPRFLWDYFSAHEQGLTGVFIEKSLSMRDHLTFFSGLHAPDFCPKYNEENGRVESKNPWFHSPPEGVLLWDQYTDVYAKIEEPRVADVVLRPTFAMQYVHDWSSTSQLKAGYAYKPINQAIIAIDHDLLLSGPTSPHQAMVSIHPEYPYAHVATLENTVGSGEWSATPSVTIEVPIIKDNSNRWISQTIGPTTSISLILERQFAATGTAATHTKGNRVYAGALRLVGGREPDRGEKASDQTFFQFRELYFIAYRLGVEGRVARIKQKNIMAKSEVTFDSEQKGGTFINELSIQMTHNLDMVFKANFIGLITADNKEYEPGFYNMNRTNDLIGVGLNYVF